MADFTVGLVFMKAFGIETGFEFLVAVDAFGSYDVPAQTIFVASDAVLDRIQFSMRPSQRTRRLGQEILKKALGASRSTYSVTKKSQ